MRNPFAILRVGAFALTLLFLSGCGKDKNLSPLSILVYDGPYPSTAVVVDVDPFASHLQYFRFHVELEDPNLSLVQDLDAWIIDGCSGTAAIDDPGGHILAPLPDVNVTIPAVVNSKSSLNYPITIVTGTWLEENAQGLVDTTDVATVTYTLLVRTHRVRDGYTKNWPITFTFTIQDA